MERLAGSTRYAAEDYSELLLHLLLPPEPWGCRCVPPHLVYAVPRMNLRPLWSLTKPSTAQLHPQPFKFLTALIFPL